MKTISYWLDRLPAPHRDRAIENFKGYKGFGYAGSAAIALNLAFDWESSPEGVEYWEYVYGMCLSSVYYDIEPLLQTFNVPDEGRVYKTIRTIVKVKGVMKIRYLYPGHKKRVPKKKAVKKCVILKEDKVKVERSKNLNQALGKMYKNR